MLKIRGNHQFLELGLFYPPTKTAPDVMVQMLIKIHSGHHVLPSLSLIQSKTVKKDTRKVSIHRRSKTKALESLFLLLPVWKVPLLR